MKSPDVLEYTLTYPHLTISCKKKNKIGFMNCIISNILDEAYKQYLPSKIKTKRNETEIKYKLATKELLDNFNKMIDEHNVEFNLDIPHLEFNK